MNEENKEILILCGDIHGELPQLIHKSVCDLKLKNAHIIVLGDFGVGFDNKIHHDYERYQNKLIDNNITIYALRGNHDDPEYFRNPDKYNYPRLKFLEDHKIYNICGREIYIIGGANSVDVAWRREENLQLAARGKNRRVWWEDEDIVQIKEENLPRRVDIILSHEAPLTFLPISTRFDELPEDQYLKILNSRKYLDTVLKHIVSDYWFYGHHHTSVTGTYGKLLYRCLNIMEFFEAPEINPRSIQGEA